jgi:hypothetical protein
MTCEAPYAMSLWADDTIKEYSMSLTDVYTLTLYSIPAALGAVLLVTFIADTYHRHHH